MFRFLILGVLFLSMSLKVQAQSSPHGADFAIDCAKCHSPQSWKFDDKVATFDHDSTLFKLTGQHKALECKSCHSTLNFKQVSSACISCHSDFHQSTVGTDCARCHTPNSWEIANFTSLHEQTSFPLMGVHATVNCTACHQSESNIRFSPTGVDCISCHRADFETSEHPDHQKLGFSQDCNSCHSLTVPDWVTDKVDHDFFPLVEGHSLKDCASCHANGDYALASPDCISCHQLDFAGTLNPNHLGLGFSTDCKQCHSLSPGWTPVEFKEHDGTFFPIYSGKHKGVWDACASCHTDNTNYSSFSCIVCHVNPETTTSHLLVSGFVYEDNACLACHPTGDADVVFDHNTTGFPLTGVHKIVNCVDCHTNGFQNTPNTCVSCHQAEYTATSNPDHKEVGISENCIDCHTTEAGWQPAKFEVHDQYYPLNGAHKNIADNCALCHNGSYNDTPKTCVACHIGEFNGTTNPNHKANHFNHDCTSCHTEDAWQPSTFNHDAVYFPIYSGKHNGVWDDCKQCHANPSNLASFTCVSCHTNPETNDVHTTVSGYQYQDNACLACHPSGDASNAFDHNQTNFPLTGGHDGVSCVQCHANGFKGTSMICKDCHANDFNTTQNPNHIDLGFSDDCIRCHSTTPGWTPASFPNHNEYYELKGAHVSIANECGLCHNGNYNNTSNTCNGCHNDKYQGTVNPNHITAQFPVECASCHSESAWTPATFNHDGLYFPVYSGTHKSVWTQCTDCHSNAANYAEITCVTCHLNPETDNQHTTVGGYIYLSNACLACHPTGEANTATFNHNTSHFPLTGAHIGLDCASCHANGNFSNTPNTCNGCHNANYTATTNPNHVALGLSTDCASCHTTAPGWSPATFAIHDNYYPLTGAHANIAGDCAACHSNGNYSNTPNTCNGCHNANYTSATNPNHIALGLSTDCASCHTTAPGWSPATFAVHNNYYPLTGAHASIAGDCAACHSNGNYSNTPNTCNGCHNANYVATTNPNHVALGLSTDCASCHTTSPGWSPATFAVHNNYYPLTGAHASIAGDCAACHSNGNYSNTPNTCNGCHNANYVATTNPNHVALGLSTDCASCHTTAPGWSPATFAVHNNYYPLTGAHANIAGDCAACHTNGNYSNTPNTCNGCHNANYTATTNPNHVALGLSTDCASCHTTAPGWSPATFAIHDNFYTLTGAHANIAGDCAACHANGNYSNTPNTCNGCHNANYTATTNPNHVALGLSTDCASCHTTAPGWSPATFAVHNNYYPLTGAHASIAGDCAACHSNGNYSNTPNTCNGCHNANYTSATNPNHVVLGLSTDCASCHTTAPGWSPATFAIHDNFYPLTGAHANIAGDCAACHANGNYSSTPNTCNGCHNANYTSATNPNHVALGLSTDCASCHTTALGWSPALFAVHNNYYPLTGAHASIAGDCAACHSNGNYSNTPNTCNGCHNANYTSATNPNHVALGLSTDCASCHTTTPGWSPATFAIHDNFYPLTGAHANIAGDCAACHANGNYSNTSNTCNGCHNANYTSAVNPNHVALGLSTDCASCHTTTPGWSPATFAIHDNFYPLTGAHANIAGDCAACHANGNYSNTPNTCNGCHNANYTSAVNPNHVALGLSTDCASCHTTTPGWSPATFAIHDNFYPLTGAHANIAGDCAACHANGNYSNTPNTCNGCHNSNYTATTNPNHVALGLSTDCASCHTTTPGWSPATFAIHDNFYPLTGAHANIAGDCAACHANGNYSNTPNTCNGCHNSNYTATTNPNHVALGLSTDCASCHTTTPGWSPATFAIHDNFYPLTGAHASIASDCAACHANGNYSNTPNTCNGCHNANYTSATNPNHVALGLSTDCASCHTTAPGWSPATFAVHNNYYPLTGAHASIASDCAACHANGNYSNTPNTCNGCHNANYTATTNPNHVALGLSTDCASCHTTAPGWSPATFAIHDNFYPLTGAHANIAGDCAACHANGNYSNTPNTCNGCHNANYTATTNPNHVALGLSTDCASCHTTAPGWSPATFAIHDNFYPLTGAHANIAGDCAACHANGNYSNTPNTCNGCHNANYIATTNPNHVALGLSTDCASCHTTAPGWSPATFAIHDNYYPLTGAHANIAGDCAACHANGNYSNTPNTCNGCHNANYVATTNPNHVALGLSTDCASCHTTAPGWSPATFAVHNNYYPLTGAHASIAGDCAGCHANGNYSNTPNTCNGCHNANYTSATNPNHVALGLSTDCASCHTTAPGWSPATFAIHDNFYPLTGAHANIAGDCAACHANGNYSNTPNTCNGCHNANYTATTNPNHVALGLSTDCASCHTTAPGWSPATFAIHDNFYPLTGAHANIAGDCAACHANGNYSNTPNTCNGCHNANYTSATNPNHVALGLSTDCASCHTTASGWSPATFAVHNNYYPLTGAHASIAGDCAACHTNGNYSNTPNTCNGCHNANYTSATNPNHVALGLSTDCASCHTTAPGWSPATFAVHNNYYPLTGAHANIAGDCAACHANGNYSNTPNTCNGCHNANYTSATNPNHVALGLSTDCASCHTTAPGWSPATFAIHDNFYPLTGAHANIAGDCAACHANGNYSSTPNTCNGCHNANYTSATNPNHVALGLSTDCASCHTTALGWSPALFAVHNNYYPLTGAHASIAGDCAACHSNGNYSNTPNTCNGCHNANYTSATNPNHVALGLSTDCASCHTTAPGWSPATFAVHNNYYPLTGAHASVAGDCAACHSNGNYSNTPNTCNGCHNANYTSATNPNHVALGLSTDCASCHTTAPGWSPATFAVHNNYYPLTGAHASIAGDCAACHSNGNYSNTPNTCNGCHNANYTSATNPNHVALGLSTDCASCHTTAPGWSPATFAVHNNYYPLTGAHASIAGDCAACHANGNYSNTPNTCNGCHNSNYVATTNPNHVALGLSTDCASCHTTAPGWSPATFAVHNNYYPLTGAHASIAGDCAACHSNGNYSNTPNTCNGCHNANYTSATNPNHVALGLSTDCASCHTTAPGWSPATFAVHNNYYPLTGAHASIASDCAACHSNGNYSNTPNTCNGCHNANYTSATNPNHVALGLSTDCASCHTTAPGWSPATFAVHNNYYPLTGAHASIAGDCAACHSNGNYSNTPNTCNGCHNANYTSATNPNHVVLGLSTDCASCHTTAPGWSPATFAVHNNYYPLTGAHASIAGDCAACHANGNYSNTPNTCNGCHNANYTSATNPNHVALGLSTDCASCHTTAPGWSPALFAVHNNYYPLTGAHASIAGDCAACHSNGNYSNTPNTCNGCHNANYVAATNPNHVALGLSTDCASCHTTAPGWSPATFAVHNNYYPLTGAHAIIQGDCAACHANGNYSNTPNTCNGCHNANYVAATNPNHVALGLSTNCVTCHTTAPGWSPATFAVHNNYYPLTGAHAIIQGDCAACHANGNYSNTPNTCNGCHNANYVAATNPNHVALGLSTNCVTCHTTAPGWSPATFAVHNNYYPLTGAHAIIQGDCAACHANGNYSNTPNTCNGCHNANYVAATNPNHVALGLSTNCVTCHTTAPGWSPATFAVHNNYYPLTGAHAIIQGDCAACHANGNYSNTPNTCNGCHNANFVAAANPNHVALGLSTNCVTCHTTAPNWSPALFPVHNNYYPLIGAHAAIASNCTECHTNGNYNNTPNTCYGCHASEYNSANSPNHTSAGFPTTCTTCHSQSAWEPSTWDHDDLYFPIYSGKHKNKWDQCSDCHANSSNFSIFSCLGCHPQGPTNSDHNGVNGYQYNSNACYACHPTGDD